MHTKCPNCETRFRINTEQLRAAQGQTRCSRCGEIFNALEQLQTAMPEGEEQEWELEESPDASAPAAEELQEAEPDPFSAEEENEPWEEELEQALPFEVPENLPPIKPSQPKPRKRRRGTFFWSLGILLLLAASLLQLAWLGRDTLVRYPESRTLLEKLCALSDCRLPARRAPDKIEVLKRAVSAHPEAKQALLIQLTFVNHAQFPQPYPTLQLGLYDREERLVARRHFLPDQYLGRKLDPSILLRPDEALSLEMSIEDPGDNVTGFKFDFF